MSTVVEIGICYKPLEQHRINCRNIYISANLGAGAICLCYNMIYDSLVVDNPIYYHFAAYYSSMLFNVSFRLVGIYIA